MANSGQRSGKENQADGYKVVAEVISLIKERWPLVIGSIVLLVFIVIASQYVYKYGVAARGAKNEPCVIKLLLETKGGGKQWMTISPKDDLPSGAEFEEVTRIHQFEITSCL